MPSWQGSSLKGLSLLDNCDCVLHNYTSLVLILQCFCLCSKQPLNDKNYKQLNLIEGIVMKRIIALMIFAVSAIALVSGCSGSDSTPAPTTLTGTAATGAPIDGTVFVKDAKGVEKSIATAVDGSFTLDVPGMAPPYLLKVTPSSGPELYSFASQNGQTVNLTPTTNLAMFLAYGKNDLNTLYVGWDGTGVTATSVAAAEGTVRANLIAEMTAKGVDVASFNLFTTPFKADGSGIDGVMDGLKIAVNPGAGSFTFTDLNDVDLGFDDTLTPPAPPVAAPAGAISILTYSGATHTLNGVYKSACYQSGGSGSQYDSLTVNGSEWINAINEFSSTDCSGSPTVSSMTATLTTLGTQVIPATTGWVDGMGAATVVQGADGTTVLSASDTTVTTLNVVVGSVTGTLFNAGMVGFTSSLFYVVDDTGSGLVIYRDAGGIYASTADPYLR